MTRVSRLILRWLTRHETQACLILDAFEEWQKTNLVQSSEFFRGIVERAKAENPNFVEEMHPRHIRGSEPEQ